MWSNRVKVKAYWMDTVESVWKACCHPAACSSLSSDSVVLCIFAASPRLTLETGTMQLTSGCSLLKDIHGFVLTRTQDATYWSIHLFSPQQLWLTPSGLSVSSEAAVLSAAQLPGSSKKKRQTNSSSGWLIQKFNTQNRLHETDFFLVTLVLWLIGERQCCARLVDHLNPDWNTVTVSWNIEQTIMVPEFGGEIHYMNKCIWPHLLIIEFRGFNQTPCHSCIEWST